MSEHEKLKEQIAKLIWDVVDWVHHEENPGLTHEGLYPSEAIDQILTAIKEGIEICHKCEDWKYLWHEFVSEEQICKHCGGKGWIMK